MGLPTTTAEIQKWTNGSLRIRLESVYMLCILIGSLEKSTSSARSDYRWITNTSKIIASGLPEYEAYLRFTVNESWHVFDSSVIREHLSELIAAGMIDQCCHWCGTPFVKVDDKARPPWLNGTVRRCEKCGQRYQDFHSVYSLTDQGLYWAKEELEPFLKESDIVAMSKTMIFGSRLLYRDSITQYDFASDIAIKISELGDTRKLKVEEPSFRKETIRISTRAVAI